MNHSKEVMEEWGINQVLILSHNNLALTQATVQSVIEQEIPTEILVIDNNSTDGTLEWLDTANDMEILNYEAFCPQLGVSAGWNHGLRTLFSRNWAWEDVQHVLVLNNDTILPPHFYSTLLSYQEGFITGIAIDDLERSKEIPQRFPLAPNPDFSAFLISKWVWQRIGEFDESMVHYSSDQDYHIRGWRKGVRMSKANVPYFHARSSTIKNAAPAERLEIEQRANLDRAALKAKWGCDAGTGPEYAALFSDSNFGIEA